MTMKICSNQGMSAHDKERTVKRAVLGSQKRSLQSGVNVDHWPLCTILLPFGCLQ